MKLVIASLASAMLAISPATACSVVSGYRIPSNFELVKKADLVVLARVSAGPAAEKMSEAGWDQALVKVTPIRALKGVLPAAPLSVRGYVSAQAKPFAAHPTPLNRAHPSAFMGACIRQQYAVGALVVVVFQHRGNAWQQESSPFARSAEDVEGVNGAWVRAAASYAKVAALPTGAARRKALQAEAKRLLALNDDAAAPAIAADMLDAAQSELD